MTLLQMNYILEINRCGSMNKAAQRLFVSQSALSSAIQEVEKELGITVFRRSNRGIALTEDGHELVGQILPIVEQSKKLGRYYMRRRESGMLHLSVAAQRYPFCAKAFVEFLRSRDDETMQLSMKEMDMSAVIHEVAEGLSDLGIIFLSELTEPAILRSLDEHSLSFTHLVTLHPHVFMRRDHPLSSCRSVTLEQLQPFPHVVFTQSGNDINFAEEAVSGSGADYERMVYVSDRASIYNIMAHTDCVSTGSGVLPPGYADDSLIALPLEDSFDMNLGYILKLSRRMSEPVEAFIAIMKRITAEMKE